MADNEHSLVMRIRTFFHADGAEAAKKSVAELQREADAAAKRQAELNKQLGSAGQIAARGAEQIGTVATAMGTMGGAAGQAAAGVRLLAGSIQTMVAAGGGLAGLLTAASLLVTSKLITWMVSLNKETASLNDQAVQTESILTRMSRVTFDAVTAQTDKLRSAASGAADEFERVLAARNRMLSAQEQADLAQIELDKLRRLSRLAPGDQLGRRAIEADAASQAASVSYNAEAERRANDVLIAERKLQEARQQADISAASISRQEALLASQEKRYAEMGQSLSSMQANPERVKPENLERLTRDMGDLAGEINRLRAAIQDQRDKAASQRSGLAVLESDVLTSRTLRAGLDIKGNASALSAGMAVSDVRADAQSRQRDLAAARSASDATLADLQRTRASEFNDTRRAFRSGSSPAEIAKQIEEYKEAARAEAAFRNEVMKQRRRDREELDRLTEALKNLPTQAD